MLFKHPEQRLFLKSAFYQWFHGIALDQKKLAQVRSILVVKLDEIGDMVNALHVFPLLSESFPEASISVWCKPMNVPLLRNFTEISSIVNDIHDLQEHYDLRIDLRGNEESLSLAKQDASAHYIGRGLVRLKNRGRQKHEIHTNIDIIRPVLRSEPPISILPSFRFSESEKLQVDDFLKKVESQFVILHTGARDVARRWPEERFVRLIQYLKEERGLRVLIGGGPDEKSRVETIVNRCHADALNICGQFNINSFAYLCSKAVLFVGNESGPLHLSWVSGCKSIGLFGPGVPNVFYPLGKDHRAIHHFQGHEPGKPESMQKISVEEVIEACNQLLKG